MLAESTASNPGSEVQSIYILLEDKVGHVANQKSIFLNAFQKFRPKTVVGGSPAPFQAYKGDLFKIIEGGGDHFDVTLMSIENKDHILECPLKDVVKLNEKEASMLLAVTSHNERYEVIQNENAKLSPALNAELGDKVKVDIGNNVSEGVLKYIGLLHKRGKGTYFGVEFEEPFGDTDGCEEDIQYFCCNKDHGIFVPIQKIEFLEKNVTETVDVTVVHAVGDGKKKTPEKAVDKKDGKKVKASKPETNRNIKAKEVLVDTRVIYFGKDNKKPVRGTIRYVGNPNPKYEGLMAGVVLDQKLDKRGTVRNNGNYCSGKKIFECNGYKAVLVKTNVLMKEEDYDNNKDYSSELKKQDHTLVQGEKLKENSIPPESIAKTTHAYDVSIEQHTELSRNQGGLSCSNTLHFNDKKSIPSECIATNTQQNNMSIEQHTEVGELSHKQSASVKNQLSLGTRVIYFGEDKPMAGVIRFVGHIKNNKKIMAGVELDNKIEGNDEGNYYVGKRIFTCLPRSKAVVVEADTLTKEADYGESKLLGYVTVNNDGSTNDDDASELKKQELKQHKVKTLDPVEEQRELLRKIKEKKNNDDGLKDDDVTELKKQEMKQYKVKTIDPVEEQRELFKKYQEKKFSLPPENISKHPTQNTWSNREQNIKLKLRSHDQSINDYKSELGIDRSGNNFCYHESDNCTYQHHMYSVSSNAEEPINTTEHIYHKDVSTEKQKSYEGNHILKESKADCEMENENLAGTFLQIGSMVEIKISNKLYYGVLKWIGTDDRFPDILAGLELENSDLTFNDGIFQGRRYFSSPLGRAFFIKARHCKPDSRFSNDAITLNVIDSKPIKSLKGFILPNSTVKNEFIGRNKGIQGHHNSCYMDSTLFAMFAYSHVFDILLNRKRRHGDINDYDEVQKILKEQIVNPLRKEAFVDHQSVLRLREYLNHLVGNIGGFLTEEKDPEEFVVLLLEKVLKVDPFIKLKINNRNEDSHLYQIFMDRDKERKRNPLPSIQYLLEHSFLNSHLQLSEIPSVMILQMPRFGQTKLYKRIQINPVINITPLLAGMAQHCVICGERAIVHCSDCAGHFGWEIVYTYLCNRCCDSIHKHSTRKNHQYTPCVPEFEHTPVSMELFAVVCIEKSHYVSFVKCGVETDENWLFFDSMADRRGGDDGYNIPEVSILYGLKDILNGNPLGISDLDKKDDEKILRFFEDSSLCFYRNKSLTMYR